MINLLFMLIPIMFIILGIICLVRPDYGVKYFQFFARPIGKASERSLPRIKFQEAQATARPFFIRLVGILLSCFGLCFLILIYFSLYHTNSCSP